MSFDTSRCKRHQAIYGEKWPYREKGVFTDLSSTTSDGEESSSSSSEGSAPIRSYSFVEETPCAEELSNLLHPPPRHCTPVTLPCVPGSRPVDEATRLRVGLAAEQNHGKSESDRFELPRTSAQSRKSRKQSESPQVISTQARKSILATLWRRSRRRTPNR
jgi:hypothetical protein